MNRNERSPSLGSCTNGNRCGSRALTAGRSRAEHRRGLDYAIAKVLRWHKIRWLHEMAWKAVVRKVVRQRYGSPCGAWVARSMIDLPAGGIFVAVLGRGLSPPNPGRLAWRSPPIQLQVTGTQVGDFLDAGTRVGHRQQRGMIALAGVGGAVGRLQQGLHFVVFKILDDALVGALEGDRQDGLAHPAVVGQQGCRVACAGVQCSQADVARRGVAALALEVLEEGERVLAGDQSSPRLRPVAADGPGGR